MNNFQMDLGQEIVNFLFLTSFQATRILHRWTLRIYVRPTLNIDINTNFLAASTFQNHLRGVHFNKDLSPGI